MNLFRPNILPAPGFPGDKNRGLRFLTSCSNSPFRRASKMLKAPLRKCGRGPHDPQPTLCCYIPFKLPRNRLYTQKMKMAQRRNASEPNLWSGRSTIGTKNQGSLKMNRRFISKSPGHVNYSYSRVMSSCLCKSLRVPIFPFQVESLQME